jgi:hypothetical protein
MRAPAALLSCIRGLVRRNSWQMALMRRANEVALG